MRDGWIFAVVLAIALAASAAPALVPAPRHVALPRPLPEAVPEIIGAWRAAGDVTGPSLPGAEVLRRRYRREDGEAVTLEVRYYARGVPHSHLLPFPGPETWERNLIEVIPVETEAGPASVNRVQAATEAPGREGRHLQVVYWYLERGRVVARESLAKLYQLRDRLARGRAEGMLVSVFADAPDRAARDRATEFARLVLPVVAKVAPR